MKKIVSLLLALMLALSLAACSAKSASSDSASMASDSYDFNGAELPDAKYDDTASDDGAWNGQEVSSAGADLAERGVKMVYTASIEMQTLEFDQAAQDILDGQPRMLDIGSFNGRNFVYTASFGAFTSVSYATPQPIKNVLGHLAYLLEGVKNLGQLQPVYADVHTDSGDYSGDFLFGSVSNTTSLAGILTLDKSLVQLDDGRFELLLVDMPRNAIEFSQLLINVAQRKFEGLLHLSLIHI